MALGAASDDFVLICDYLDIPPWVLGLACSGGSLLCDRGVNTSKWLLNRCSDCFLHSANLFNYKHA